MTETKFQGGAEHPSHDWCRLYITSKVPTREDAEAIAVLFPTSAKVKATRISGNMLPDGGYEFGNPECIHRSFGYVTFRVDFEKNGVTGEFNETGLRRYRTFRRACNNLGFEVVWTTPFTNSFATEAEFENFIQGA